MHILKSIVIAMSMYSKIPMPHVEWNDKNRRYSMCFFPLVGLIEGLLFWGLWKGIGYYNLPELTRGVLLTLLPLVVTGGIHIDGFLDTMDALNSHQNRQRKLEILKDSHTGAFAIIAGVMYVLLYAGGVVALNNGEMIEVVGLGFILSRVLSGWSVVTMKNARTEGLLYAFSSVAHRRVVRVVLIVIGIGVATVMLWINWKIGIGAIAGVAVGMIYYLGYLRRQFGGITGDLAGCFLQVTELLMIYGVIVAGKC